jgi:hypothetical protein
MPMVCAALISCLLDDIEEPGAERLKEMFKRISDPEDAGDKTNVCRQPTDGVKIRLVFRKTSVLDTDALALLTRLASGAEVMFRELTSKLGRVKQIEKPPGRKSRAKPG